MKTYGINKSGIHYLRLKDCYYCTYYLAEGIVLTKTFPLTIDPKKLTVEDLL